jgi:hypothetical protein
VAALFGAAVTILRLKVRIATLDKAVAAHFPSEP